MELIVSIWDAPQEVISPSDLSLQGIAPNPMTSLTTISYQSSGFSEATLEVYDINGRLVRTQNLGSSPAGQHTAMWNGCGFTGEALGNGVFIIRLVSESGNSVSASIVLLR